MCKICFRLLYIYCACNCNMYYPSFHTISPVPTLVDIFTASLSVELESEVAIASGIIGLINAFQSRDTIENPINTCTIPWCWRMFRCRKCLDWGRTRHGPRTSPWTWSACNLSSVFHESSAQNEPSCSVSSIPRSESYIYCRSYMGTVFFSSAVLALKSNLG